VPHDLVELKDLPALPSAAFTLYSAPGDLSPASELLAEICSERSRPL